MDLIKRLAFKYIIPPVGMMIILLLGITYRKRIEGGDFEQALFNKGIMPVYALWHGRIFFMPYFYRRQWKMYCLVSPSIDGEIIARILSLFGMSVIRGSSYKGGGKAFRQLVRVAREGRSPVIIVDGSRGPACKVQGGVIHLARLGNIPILPITYGAEKAVVLKSWDRFIIPYPFTRVVVIFGEPVHVSRDDSEYQIEEKRVELEKRLMEITERADHYFEAGKS